MTRYYSLTNVDPKYAFELNPGSPYGYGNNVPNLVANSNDILYGDRCYYLYDANPVQCCYEQTPYADPSYCNNFTVAFLASNKVCDARNFDINLLDPYGILIINDVIWVASAGTGLITSYNLEGGPLCMSINVFGPGENIASPTAIVVNTNVTGFLIMTDSKRRPSTFIISTRDGTVNGYNADVQCDTSIVLIDNSANNSVYTGMTYYNSAIYLADFYNAKIDVYDKDLNKLAYPFIDEYSTDPIPADYAPFNIVTIIDMLYVAYAKQDPRDNQRELHGQGNGYISVFTPKGIFVKRFASRGPLNAPWGIVLAPSEFGFPAGSIMVSNSGNGSISVFDCEGNCLGNLKDGNGNEIIIDGIRALVINPCYRKNVYFSSQSADNLKVARIGAIYSNLP